MTTKTRKWLHILARFGCFSFAIIYIMVGVVALLSLMRLKNGGADEGSILTFLKQIPFGVVVIWIIMVGILCFVTWRFVEVFTDPYGYGNKFNGIVKRTGIALGTIADILIAFSALQALLGKSQAKLNGQPVGERKMVSEIFQWNHGHWVVGLMGAVVFVTAVLQFVYVIRKDYKERLNVGRLAEWKKKGINILAWSGYAARGIIVGIIAFFLVRSAIRADPQDIVNTDKAFNFLGEQVGHPAFVLVALGTIAYGWFMVVMGLYYDFDKDRKKRGSKKLQATSNKQQATSRKQEAISNKQ